MPIIDGQKLSRSIREELKAEVERLSRTPVLAVVLVGNDQESERYVNMKKRVTERSGTVPDTSFDRGYHRRGGGSCQQT